MSPVWRPINLMRMALWFVHLLLTHAGFYREPRSAERTVGTLPRGREEAEPFSAIVTGASSGLGLAIATSLARRGHRVILVCRTERSASAALAAVAKRAAPTARLETQACDLSDPLAVLRLCERIRRAEKRSKSSRVQFPLRHLVCNAGAYCGRLAYAAAPNGLELEMTFASNFFGHYVLRRALEGVVGWDSVVHTTSFSHRAVSGRELRAWLRCAIRESGGPNLSPEPRSWSPAMAYACSKMASILARRDVEGPRCRQICLDPGAVDTEITREWPWALRCVYTLVMRALGLFQDPNAVAESLVRELEGRQGGLDENYIFGAAGERLRPSSLAFREDLERDLCMECDRLYDKCRDEFQQRREDAKGWDDF